jgi:iron complex outermembrane receptor protein
MKIKTTMPSVRSVFLTGVSFLGLTVGAGAQEPGRYFNIPDQAAASAIPEFARSADVQIIVSADDIEGKRVHGLRGTYPVREALNRLMDGTNIRVQKDDGKTIVLGNGGAEKNVQLAQAAPPPDSATVETVVVTASKRAEDLQNTSMSVQAVTSKQLKDLTVNNFQDYVKYLPSVSFLNHSGLAGGIGGNMVYMRGISDGNISPGGPMPTVGTYLDDLPITDIGGTLNVHIYDVARMEVLPGPQGTLYGASSEAGTLKIVTNQPDTSGFSGSVNIQGNTVAHGGQGFLTEGYLNIPLNDSMAIRLVAFDEMDAGYIDNTPASRTYATSKQTTTNAAYARDDFNTSHTIGGRAALKIDLDDTWTLTPSIMAQTTRGQGTSTYQPSVGYLKVNRFSPDTQHDEWVQSALTITGKIADLDVTYAASHFERSAQAQSDYTDYSIFYDALFGSGAGWTDNSGHVIGVPTNSFQSRYGYSKTSNEFRLASPSTDRLRFIGGLFYENQTNNAMAQQNIANYATAKSVIGYPTAYFLTDQHRTANDAAIFGEVSYDITDKLTLLGGLRVYDYHNTLLGYYGYTTTPFGTAGSKCLYASNYKGVPCITTSQAANGEGETHKINLTYKIDDDALTYLTYSTGFRPGGTNRVNTFAPYNADTLANYEAGWKTSWLGHSLVWNGAVYYEDWSNFQFSYRTPNGFYVYQNAPSAAVYGVETNLDWTPTSDLTISGGGTYNYSSITQDFCGTDAALKIIQNCTGQPIQIRKGTLLPFTPRIKGNVTARYTFDLMGLDAHLQGSLLYRGPITNYLTASDVAGATAAGVYKSGSYTTADLSFGVEQGSRLLELFVKNLFDTHGNLGVQAPCPVAYCGLKTIPGAPQAVYQTPLQPLTIGIKLEQNF